MEKKKVMHTTGSSVLLLCILLILGGVGKSALVTSSEGTIREIEVEPKGPSISENVNLNIQVENPTNTKKNYRLKLLITREGLLEQTEEFNISIKGEEKNRVDHSFKPKKTGVYHIVAKLNNRHNSLTYSKKVSGAVVGSEIGPFDISIKPVSESVKPEQSLPFLLNLENHGKKGKEVTIQARMTCKTGKDRLKSFKVYLPSSKNKKELYTSINTLKACRETGIHRTSFNLFVQGKEWVSSTTDIKIKDELKPIKLKFPDKIETQREEPQALQITVQNQANKPLKNLKTLIEGINTEWYTIEPKEIPELKKGEKAMFVANLSVPKNAEEGTYSFKIFAGADESLVSGRSSIKILGSGSRTDANGGKLIDQIPNIPELPDRKLIIVGGFFIVAIALFTSMRIRKSRRKKEKLNRIKREIGV